MRKKYSFLILSLSIFLSLFFSCGDPAGPVIPQPDPEAVTPEAPDQVMIKMQGSAVKVEWSAGLNAENYTIYRKVGNSGFIPMDTQIITGTQFEDTTYPQDKTLQYAVKSQAGSRSSSMSSASNTVSVFVQGITVSKLAYTNKITLMWNSINDPDFENYVVERYESISDPTPDNGQEDQPVPVATWTQTTNTCEETYSDDGILPGKPYYYRVKWEKSGITYGANAPFVLGIYRSEIDPYETNDDYKPLEGSSTSVFEKNFWLDDTNWLEAPYIYSFADGAYDSTIDVDWYKYKGNPTAIVPISVKLSPDTPFKTDDAKLYFQFYTGSQYLGDPQLIQFDGVENETSFWFDNGVFDGTEREFYFKIYPVASTSADYFGKYKVFIGDPDEQ